MNISLSEKLFMMMRKSPSKKILTALTKAENGGVEISAQQVEAHFPAV